MSRHIPPFLNEARHLVLSGRVADATALIQERLGGSAGASATPPSPPFDGPTIELRAERSTGSPPEQPKGAPPRSRPRFPRVDAATVRPARPAVGPAIPPGARFLHLHHEGPAGRRAYRLYVPAAPAQGPRPLLVMLHGCTQNPEDFATGTRMNQLAEEMNILVAYPEQVRTANASLCWNWFEPAHQERGAGEPAILAGIVADVIRDHAVDRDRIFAAGISAGGAMAAVLGATYPDLFAAIGVHSGLPHGSAGNVASALSVMRSGRSAGRATPHGARAIVIHGASDTTVHPANGERLAGLAGADAGRTETQSGTTNGRAFTQTIVPATTDAPAIEHWRIEGLGHAWSGGDARGSYADPAGPDASREMLRFFLEADQRDQGPMRGGRASSRPADYAS